MGRGAPWEHESFVANVAQKVMYEDVGITDELALLVEQGVEISRLDNDSIRQWQHMAGLTALFKPRSLADRTTNL